MPDLWIERTHPQYAEMVRCAEYAWDHYTGAVKDKVLSQAGRLNPGMSSDWRKLYLTRRVQGESVEAYQERAAISRFPRHMSKVIGSFTGNLFAVEEKASRVWGPEEGEGIGGLGDPDEPASRMYRLWRDCDGQGTNWMTRRKQHAARLCATHRVWYGMLPPRDTADQARSVLFDPADVTNWYEEDGVLQWVIVREMVDRREDPKATKDPEPELRYILYTHEGYERYRIMEGEGGSARTVEFIADESAAWSRPFYQTAKRLKTRLPVAYKDLDLDGHVGYLIAQDANYLYNLLSDPRNTLRVANHPRLSPTNPEGFDDTEFEEIADKIGKGFSLLQHPAEYISPDPANATAAYDIYKEEVKDFYVTAFQEYEDRARERTATEVEQEQSGGRFSFLTLLAGSVDEIENDELFLLTQIEFPDTPDLWGSAHVERSSDFKPVNATEEAERLHKRYFGHGPVPVGASGKLDAVTRIAHLDGIAIDEDEARIGMEEDDLAREQERAEALALDDLNLNGGA